MQLHPLGGGRVSLWASRLALSLFLCLVCTLAFGHSAMAQTPTHQDSNDPLATTQIPREFSLAGLTLRLPTFEERDDGSLYAPRAELSVPGPFPASSSVHDVTVKDGKISIGGGKFDLPRIKVADFILGLRGSIETNPNGVQIIKAGGSFTLPGLAAPTGCSGIEVDVTLEQDDSGGIRMTLQPPPAQQSLVAVRPSGPYLVESPDKVKFSEAQLKLNCAIPIGATGFELKSVSGSVTLADDNTTIQIAASVATKGEVLGKSIVSADGQVTLNTSPFRLALESGVKLFIFDAATTQAEITAKSFSGVLKIELIVARGDVSVNSWVDSQNDFHLTGSGRMEVGVPKGKVYQKCIKVLFIKFRCVKVPPKDLVVGNVQVQVGEFQNEKWGVKGSVKVLKYEAGFYIDTQGAIQFGNVSSYKLVTPETVAMAHASWSDAGARHAASAYSDYQFASLTSAFPLTVSTTITQPSELIFTLVRGEPNPTLRLISPEGISISQNDLPANVSYEEVEIVTDDPEELPGVQIIFTVANAQPGEWLAVLEGEPVTAESYFFEVVGHPDAPVVEAGESAVVSSAANSATVSWRIRSNNPETYVAIYANPGPITQTVYSSAGDFGEEVFDQYDGYVLAEDIAALTNGELQSYEVNTDFLPSGTYRIWIEVDDGVNDPVEFYLPQPLVINRTNDFAGSWTPTVTVEPGYDEAYIQWSHHPSPDVTHYKVYLSDQPGNATPEQALDSFSVGYDNDFHLVGLDSEEPLYLAIGAFGDAVAAADGRRVAGAERFVLSPEFKVEARKAFFAITPSTTAVTLAKHGSANVTLNLSSDLADFPEEVFLFDDCLFAGATINALNLFLPLINGSVQTVQQPLLCREGDGLAVTFSSDHVMPTTSGVSVSATISSTNTPPGLYLVPIVGVSDDHEVVVNIQVTVTN
ncbi:MAG TPA: hypothetical protein GYA08_01980 [Chloroflexi bacterium]|nr:hypothetical protein [Chloroflexota bacterium]